MDLGTALLALSLAAGAASLALAVAPRLAFEVALAWSRRAFVASWAFLAGAFALMLASFFAGDVRIEYVWEHTRTDYPWYYRMAGLWGGQKGTALMWAFFMSTALLVEWRRVLGPLGAARDRIAAAAAAARSLRAAHVVLLGVVLAFTAFLVADHAFAPTPGHLLNSTATKDGRGLIEILKTPLMVIHPPLQFVAYALTAMPAAVALGALATRAPTREWVTPALKWARVAWLFTTVGLGLGGLWAYYVLSFGGYWAWDPVETANLMPWLALTAFLHAGKHAERFDEFRLAAPLLAASAFWLTLFATFATRSGLWVSVHAFTDPTSKFDPDAASRLVSIMEAHLPTRFFVGLLVVVAVVSVALLVSRFAPEAGARGRAVARAYAVLAAALGGLAAAAPTSLAGLVFEAGRVVGRGDAAVGTGLLVAFVVLAPLVWLFVEQPEPPSRARTLPRRLMGAAVVVFGIATAVAFLLNMQSVNGFERGIFDARAPFVAVPLVLVLTTMLAHAVIGARGALALSASALVLGVGAAAVWRDQWVVALAVPTVGAAIAAALLKIQHVTRGAPPRVRVAGQLVLVASVLGMIMWSNPPTRLDLGVGVVTTGIAHGIVFFGLSALGFVGAVAALRGVAPRLALAGAAGATLAAGYGVGAVLGVAGLALLARHRGAFANGSGLADAVPNLRQSGIYLVHLAVAVGLMGYAASTYAQDGDAFMGARVGDSLDFADGSVTVLDATGTDRVLVVPLDVEQAGRVTRADLAFEWKGDGLNHYAQDLRVERGLFADVYAAGFGIGFTDGTSVRTLEPTPPRSPAEVRSVTFELTVLPLMSFVWAGLWMMGLGMSLILATAVADARRTARATATRVRVKESGSPVAGRLEARTTGESGVAGLHQR